MNGIELEDDGFIPIRINGTEAQADLFQINNRLYDLGRQSAGKPAADYLQAVVDYLKELGFETVSHRLADKFVRAVTERVGELKNADGAASKAGRPASTEQASAPSPPG